MMRKMLYNSMLVVALMSCYQLNAITPRVEYEQLTAKQKAEKLQQAAHDLKIAVKSDDLSLNLHRKVHHALDRAKQAEMHISEQVNPSHRHESKTPKVRILVTDNPNEKTRLRVQYLLNVIDNIINIMPMELHPSGKDAMYKAQVATEKSLEQAIIKKGNE